MNSLYNVPVLCFNVSNMVILCSHSACKVKKMACCPMKETKFRSIGGGVTARRKSVFICEVCTNRVVGENVKMK